MDSARALWHTPLNRRRFLVGAGAVAASMTLYAGEIARHELSETHRAVILPRLGSAFNGHRVLQISDIHLDEYTEPFFLERVVNRINAIAPDVVLLTGDFVTRGSLTFVAARHAASRCAEILAGIRTPERFACLGNHDNTVGAGLVTSALEAKKIPVFVNRYISLDRGGERLWIGGTDDPGTGRPDLERSIPAAREGALLLMAHAPDYADTLLEHPLGARVDLMLSGHSHGGQVRLPLAGALVLPPLGRKYVEGMFTLGSLQLYVNRGIGTVGLPFRLNCPPEITVFTLQSASG